MWWAGHILLLLSFINIDQNTVVALLHRRQCYFKASNSTLLVNAHINKTLFIQSNTIFGTCNVSTSNTFEVYRLQWLKEFEVLKDCPRVTSENMCSINTTLPMKTLSPITCRVLLNNDTCDLQTTSSWQTLCNDGSKIRSKLSSKKIKKWQNLSGKCITQLSSHGINISTTEWILNNETVNTCYHNETNLINECKIEKNLSEEITGSLICRVTMSQDKRQTVCTTTVARFIYSYQIYNQSFQTTERIDYSGDDYDQPSNTSSMPLKSSSVSDLVFQDIMTSTIAISNSNDISRKSSRNSEIELIKSIDSNSSESKRLIFESSTLVSTLAVCVILLLLSCMCGGFFMYRKIRKLQNALSKVSSLELAHRPASAAPPRPPKKITFPDSLNPPDGYEPMGPAIVPIYDQINKSLEDKEVDYDEVYAHLARRSRLSTDHNWAV